MRSRPARVSLTLLAVGVIGAAAYLCWRIQTQAGAEAASAAAFHDARAAALRDTYELRSAQQAYVAAGQNETFWFHRVTAAAESVRAGLERLKFSTGSQAVTASVEEAAAALQDFEEIDRRARAYANGGQKLLASDVIFSDGLEAAARITAALDQAGAAMSDATGGVLAEAQRAQVMAAAGAAGIAMLALLLLTPAAAAPAAAVQEPQREPMRVSGSHEDLELGSLMSGEPRDRTGGAARPEPPLAAPAAPVEMQGLASLCTELARLADTSLLPGILEKTADALDASGLVLWIADPDGKELMPLAAHGYPASVLSRLGSLTADAENATAAAFRTCLLQTVSADALSNGAIAVPLMGPTGCRGVMSAEVRHGAEKQPARLAAASIVAAQLATLLGPPSVREAVRTG